RNTAADQLSSDISRLVAAGARQFLVPNLPPLGFTPRFSGNSQTQEDYNGFAGDFNTRLAYNLDCISASNPYIIFHRFDVFGLFNQSHADPAAFGLVNVTDSAAP